MALNFQQALFLANGHRKEQRLRRLRDTDPCNNAMLESFFAPLRTELTETERVKTRAAARAK